MNTLKLTAFDAVRQRAVKATLLFGGDLCAIGRYEEKILNGERVFDEPLEDLFRQSDVAIVNLEAPLCEAKLPTDSPGGFGLRADPRIAAYVAHCGIDVAGLANNHIRDYGDEGVLQTLRNLKKQGVLTVGAGRNLAEAQKPLALEVNGIRVGIWALAEKELNVATESSAGSSWFRPEEDAGRIRALRAGFDVLIVFLHAGHEFIETPSPRIRKAYRGLIDAGADAVVGHHPHVMEGVERYKHGLIAYSLGNLVFDSPYVSAYPHTDLGYLLRLGISKHGICAADVIPYRLRPNATVTPLDRGEFAEFARWFRRLSTNITNERRFLKEWEANARFRWKTEYRRILNDLSRNFNDVENKDYARRTKNLFTCPTHVEMLEKILSSLDEGKLSRQS